ncbi:CRISPR-associated endonuclease Cas2 [Candidatus Nomurabacteria bacterium]|nr:CRISPR-associated endonuclease Cas2 [Candidatus Nomurabacteria bacterium]
MSKYYKGVKVNSFGLPILISEKKNSIIKNPKRLYLGSFLSPFQKDSVKNLIIMYDIPSEQKKERDWFRRHLIKFGYVMIQKSVWVGPSPLPKDFTSYLKEIKIGDNFKTFKLAKPYDTKKSSM